MPCPLIFAALAAAAAPTFGASIEASAQLQPLALEAPRTNYRGFDGRPGTLTLENAFVFIDMADDDLMAPSLRFHLALQVGSVGAAYYAAEPNIAGGDGVADSDALLWRHVQQANVGVRVPVLGRPLDVDAGVFLSPIGPESIAIKDNWHWSRSVLFFGLPFYHTGLRAILGIAGPVSVMALLTNGWNSVVDNNPDKSAALSVVVDDDDLSGAVTVMSGVERSLNDPARDALGYRTMLDAHVTWQAIDSLTVRAHGNVGGEPTSFGLSRWAAGALGARFSPSSFVDVSARVDALVEDAASAASAAPDVDASGATPIFFPSPLMSAATVSVGVNPVSGLRVIAEARGDVADGDVFVRSASERAAQQLTLTLGVMGVLDPA